MSSTVRLASLLAGMACLSLAATPATGQDTGAGQVASSSVGQQGQRVAAPTPAIRPLARIDGRIANRVQSRIRNRIDRFYTPQANATSPFVVADDQARAAGRGR